MTARTPKSAADIHGLEYDWLACDEEGLVAFFGTAGAGYAPPEFLRDTEAHDAATAALLELPAATVARFAPHIGEGLVNTWALVAERGVYAYDCHPSGGPYRLVAAPMVPTKADDLPGVVADVAREIRLPVRFAHQTVVTEAVLRARP